MSHRKPSQGKTPTKPISFDATGDIDIVPPAGPQSADLSGMLRIFVENKSVTRFSPLNLSGLAPRTSVAFGPENYD
jgi:hypothetical protein